MNERDLELRHLRYFVAVAEELHFARAAERLHIAQPPLSQQIRQLEDLLGYPRFTRTTRSVRLTPAGDLLLQRARRTFHNLQRDLGEARSIARGELGSLSIGFVGSAMLSALPTVLRTYRQLHPGVELKLHESFTSQVIEGLSKGSLEAGILRDSDPDPHLQVTTLFAEPYVAVLPRTHALATRKSISPALLRGEPFVYFPRSAGLRAFEKPLTLFEEHGFRPHIVQEGTHWLTILRLVEAGLGVSVAPRCVRRIAAAAAVVCLPLRGTRLTSEVELAYPHGPRRPILDAFASIAQRVWARQRP